jgi:hypothetical protein
MGRNLGNSIFPLNRVTQIFRAVVRFLFSQGVLV